MSNDHNNLLDQYVVAAELACKQGHLSNAALILKEGLRECEDYYEIHDGLIEQAHSLAEMYMHQLRFIEAELLYRAVLEVREKILGQTHHDVVDSLKKVAVVQIMAFRAEALGPTLVRSMPNLWSDAIANAS